MPRLSIITPCLNNAEGLERTLESLKPLCSKMKGSVEHLIVDSSPSIHSPVLNRPEFGYLRKLESKPEGVYAALNKGTGEAQSEILWHLHAGDSLINVPTFLMALEKLENGSEAKLLFAPVILGKKSIQWETYKPKPIFRENLLGHNGIVHPGVLFKKNIFKEVGLFDLQWEIAGDFDLFIRVAEKKFEALYFDQPFAWFEMDGLSQRKRLQGYWESRQINRKLSKTLFEKLKSDFNLGFRWMRAFLFSPLLRWDAAHSFLKRFHGLLRKD